jgi:hypothetical protein
MRAEEAEAALEDMKARLQITLQTSFLLVQ